MLEPGEDVFTYVVGTEVTVRAHPDSGYIFTHWSGSAVDAQGIVDPCAANTSLIVDAHYTLVAHFMQTRIFVDDDAQGNNDGSTWEDAYTSLQDALAHAKARNEVCVAQGRYTPDQGQLHSRGDYTVSFTIPSGVLLKGGFAGVGHPQPDQRDIELYETILSGDLNSDDDPVRDVHDLYDEFLRLDNSFHIVTAQDADDTTLLEGFTITGGNSYDGAGIQLIRSHIVIRDCTLHRNRAGRLSGDGLDGWGQGAGISCLLGQPTLERCTFQTNWAGAWGAAFYSLKSHPILRDCLFETNHAGLQGGALCIQDGNAVVVDSIFQGNRSWDGGALALDEDSEGRVTHCRFLGNGSRGAGGTILLASRQSFITNCLFNGNLAGIAGGALAQSAGENKITSCTFGNNQSENRDGPTTLSLVESVTELTNCILWDDQSKGGIPLITLGGSKAKQGRLTVSYCVVKRGVAAITRGDANRLVWGTGNLDQSPGFLNPAGPDNIPGTLDDLLHLGANSPCIDAGNNTAVPLDSDDLNDNGITSERIPRDLDSQNRFVDDPAIVDTGVPDPPKTPAVIDIGAYERLP